MWRRKARSLSWRVAQAIYSGSGARYFDDAGYSWAGVDNDV